MLRILCFAEAAADARTGRGLADRVLAEEGPDWVEPELLPALRHWSGVEARAEFSKWTELKLARISRKPRAKAQSSPRKQSISASLSLGLWGRQG